MNECPCTRDCPRRNPRCHGECEEYAKWKAKREAKKQQLRAPYTVGFWNWQREQLADEIKQRRRGKGGRRGGGTGER